MYILILILPLLGSILAGLYGHFFGREGSAFLSTISLFLSWLLGLFIFYEVGLCHSIVDIQLYQWFILDVYMINIGLLFDALSSTMIVVVTTISMFVHLYSVGYMSHDPHLSRFMCYLSFFTFFMLVLVTSNNFLQLFVGWEGVGLCSYLLINFWFTRILANKAALKAMIMNRIADVFFVLAILLIVLTFKTTDYILVFNLIPFIVTDSYLFMNFTISKVQFIAFFLFIGAIGKSAQIGLHTWLPDAMEGPTPVSSLLHAATMVTAGVFMIVRCSVIFEYSESVLILLMLFGGITALFAGLIAIFQFDLKKIIAYSTCSQLGYMFFTCGLSNYNLAFFHLFNHAFFKALLFLSAGSLIHAFMDEQDLRKMGQLRETIPFTLICFFIGSFAIMGVPFLTGFYSKDLILEFAYSRYLINANFVFFLGIVSAVCTSIYSIRIVFLLFSESKKINGFFTIYNSFSTQHGESPWQMFIPMFCLAFGSIFIGYLASDLLMGFGQNFWQESIFILPAHFSPLDTEFIHPLIKNLPVILSLLFMFLTYFFLYFIEVWSHTDVFKHNKFIRFIYPFWCKLSAFFYHAGFINTIYNYGFEKIMIVSYTAVTKYLDKGFFEFFGPYGLYKGFHFLYNFLRFSWYSVISISVFIMFIGICLLLIYLFIVLSNIYIVLLNYCGLVLISLILLISLNNNQ